MLLTKKHSYEYVQEASSTGNGSSEIEVSRSGPKSVKAIEKGIENG